MDGLRGEMLEARQETVWGDVFFLHAELRRKEKGKKVEDKTRKRVREGLKEDREKSGGREPDEHQLPNSEHTSPDSLTRGRDFIGGMGGLRSPRAEPSRSNE